MSAPKIVHYPRNPHLKPTKPHLFRLTDCGRRARGRAVSECIYFVTLRQVLGGHQQADASGAREWDRPPVIEEDCYRAFRSRSNA